MEKELNKTKWNLQVAINTNLTFEATLQTVLHKKKGWQIKIKELKKKFTNSKGAYVELTNIYLPLVANKNN